MADVEKTNFGVNKGERIVLWGLIFLLISAMVVRNFNEKKEQENFARYNVQIMMSCEGDMTEFFQDPGAPRAIYKTLCPLGLYPDTVYSCQLNQASHCIPSSFRIAGGCFENRTSDDCPDLCIKTIHGDRDWKWEVPDGCHLKVDNKVYLK